MIESSAFVALEAERCVLGAALVDAGAAHEVCMMHENDFHEPKNRAIFQAIQALGEAKQPVDLVTVDGWLGDHKRLAQAGGFGYIADTAQYVPTSANVGTYIAMVRDAAMRRRIQTMCTDAVKQLGNGSRPPLDVLNAHSECVRIAQSTVRSGTVDMSTAIMRFADALAQRGTADRGPRMYTGVPTLDARLGGVSGGKLFVVGARPGIGKSAFALSCALATCRAGGRVLIVSLEMDEVEIMSRIVARYADVPVDAIERGQLSSAQQVAIAQAYGQIDRNQLDFCSTARTVADVRHEAYLAKSRGDLALVVVDYIGLLRSGERAESRRVEVGQITRQLKLLAGELKVPVMAVSQLNRKSEGGTNRAGQKISLTPTMAELRESGDVEQDANMILLLHQPEEGNDAEEQIRIDRCRVRGLDYVVLMLEKNRQGRRGVFPVAFDGAHMRYERIVGEGTG